MAEQKLRKRVRMRAKTKAEVEHRAKYDVERLAEEAAKARVAFQKAQAELSLAESNLFTGMMETKTWTVHPKFAQDGANVEAQIEVITPMGKSSTTIDPRKFHRLVDSGLLTDQQFYDTISVGITKARNYLGEKQISKVATTTPAEKKDPALLVQYVLVDGTPVFGKLPKK